MSANTIIVSPCLPPIYEGTFDSVTTPGELLALASDGNYDPNGTADIALPVRVAIEDALQGKTITDTYEAGSNGRFAVLGSGDIAYMFLAPSQTIAAGAKLEASTAGNLTALGAGIALVEALEAVTTAGTRALIKVMKL